MKMIITKLNFYIQTKMKSTGSKKTSQSFNIGSNKKTVEKINESDHLTTETTKISIRNTQQTAIISILFQFIIYNAPFLKLCAYIGWE